MANVFISYARRDRERVLVLASALEHEGLSVWWDPNLVPGKRFRDIIARELAAADSVVVVWTAASIQSDYVQDEAEEARERGVLVPITLEPVKAPAGFRQVQAADLTQWAGGKEHPEYRMMVTAVRTLVEAARAEDAEAAPSPAPAVAPAPVSPPSVAPVTAPAATAQPASAPAAAQLGPGTAPSQTNHPGADFLPRLFDMFAHPTVWGAAAVLVVLTGIWVGFGLSGTAAAMVLWAGAMAGVAVGAGMSPSRKTTVMVIALGVALIVAASTHSLSGLVTAALVGGAVFAGTTLIQRASGRGAAVRRSVRAVRRLARDSSVASPYQNLGEDIRKEVLESIRSRRGRPRRPRAEREG